MIDPKSKVLLTDCASYALATGRRKVLVDYAAGMAPGQLREQLA